MATSFALRVQRLERNGDRVLTVGHLVGARNEDGWFSPGEVSATFEALRLPRPGNISQELARLRQAGLVIRRTSGGSWALTAEGGERLRSLMGTIDAKEIHLDELSGGASIFDAARHPLIPAELAPASFAPAVKRLIDRYPFERNVFCMTRFPCDPPEAGDPVPAALVTIKEALADQGLVMHLASDRSADDALFPNVAAHLWGCKYGISLLETRTKPELNDNVLVELGAMLVTGRRCAILKDRDAPKPPSDFVAQIYRELDLADQDAVHATVSAWVREDLGL